VPRKTSSMPKMIMSPSQMMEPFTQRMAGSSKQAVYASMIRDASCAPTSAPLSPALPFYSASVSTLPSITTTVPSPHLPLPCGAVTFSPFLAIGRRNNRNGSRNQSSPLRVSFYLSIHHHHPGTDATRPHHSRHQVASVRALACQCSVCTPQLPRCISTHRAYTTRMFQCCNRFFFSPSPERRQPLRP